LFSTTCYKVFVFSNLWQEEKLRYGIEKTAARRLQTTALTSFVSSTHRQRHSALRRYCGEME
jgi:hypothetical protein